jgi:acetyl-CoA carboxylase alpha subunit
MFDVALDRALRSVSAMDPQARLDARYRKFRAMGNIGISEPE